MYYGNVDRRIFWLLNCGRVSRAIYLLLDAKLLFHLYRFCFTRFNLEPWSEQASAQAKYQTDFKLVPLNFLLAFFGWYNSSRHLNFKCPTRFLKVLATFSLAVSISNISCFTFSWRHFAAFPLVGLGCMRPQQLRVSLHDRLFRNFRSSGSGDLRMSFMFFKKVVQRIW